MSLFQTVVYCVEGCLDGILKFSQGDGCLVGVYMKGRFQSANRPSPLGICRVHDRDLN